MLPGCSIPGTVSSSCDVNDEISGDDKIIARVTDRVDGQGDNALGLMPCLLAEDLTDCQRGIPMRIERRKIPDGPRIPSHA